MSEEEYAALAGVDVESLRVDYDESEIDPFPRGSLNPATLCVQNMSPEFMEYARSYVSGRGLEPAEGNELSA